MGFFSDIGNWIVDPLGTALGIKGPGDIASGQFWKIPEDVHNDWVAFKHLLVPDMRRDREVQVQSASNARNIIYGKTRVGNQIAYAETTGTANQTFHILCIHAGHEIDGYEEIYFDDHLVASAAGGWTILAPYAGKAAIEFHDGSQMAADTTMIAASAGVWTINHKLLGCAYTHITLTYDEGAYPAGLPTVKAVIRGKKVLDTRTNQIAWSSNPAMCIRDYMLMPVNQGGMGCDRDEINEASFIAAANICDQQVYSNQPADQAPGVKTTVKPTLGWQGFPSTRYTLNGEIKLDGIPTQFIKSMLTSCAGDAVYSGGQWKISVGAPAATVATIDESWLNGAISFQTGANKNDKINTAKGTFTNSNDYWADTEFPSVPVGISTPPNTLYWNALGGYGQYAPAMTYQQNNYVIFASKVYMAYSTTTVPINTPPPNSTYWVLIEEYDAGLQYPPGHTVQRAALVYTAVTTVPAANPYITEDAGEELTANLSLPFTITSPEAQRLAKIVLEKSRRGLTVSYPCNHKAFSLDVMDVVAVNNSLLGWNNQMFRVVGWTFSLMSGTSLSLTEYDAAIYDWVPGDSTPLVAPILTNLPDPWTVWAPLNLNVVESLYTGNIPSVVMSKATFTWIAGDAHSTIFDVYLDGDYYATVTDFSVNMYNMKPGLHTFSVRASNTLGAHSATVMLSTTIHGNTAPPSDVTGFTISFAGNLLVFTWIAVPDFDIDSYEIRSGASWDTAALFQAGIKTAAYTFRPTGSGTVTYLIKAKDTTRNYSANAAVATVTIPAADVPTAIVTIPEFMEIDLDVTFDTSRQDTMYVEIWAAVTNDRGTASSVGITKDKRWRHSGLGNTDTRYYWARCITVFGETGAWYPAGATAGVMGSVLNDPSQALKLLNSSIDDAKLAQYLLKEISLSQVMDTASPTAIPGVFTGGVDARLPDLILATAQHIVLHAGEIGKQNTQIELLNDRISLKLNSQGHVAGMTIGWNESGDKSETIFVNDVFKIALPDGTGIKTVFTVGTLNGVSTVGIDGNVIVDGSVSAKSLIADSAMLDFLNARKIVAGSVTADNVTAGTFTGSTFQTAATGTRFVVSSTDNLAHFYGYDYGVLKEIVTLGAAINNDIRGVYAVTTDGAKTTNYYPFQFGAIEGYNPATRSGGCAVLGTSLTLPAVVGVGQSGPGVSAASETGYSVIAYCAKPTGSQLVLPDNTAPLLIMPSAASGVPTHAALMGAMWVTSTGDFYGCKGGTMWVKII